MTRNSLVYVLFFCIVAVLAGCHDEIAEFSTEKEPVTVLPDGKLRIPLTFSFPPVNKVDIATRATSEKTIDESMINTIWVLVFEASREAEAEAGDRLLQLQRGVVNHTADMHRNRTYVDLDPTDSSCRILVVSNLSGTLATQIEQLVTVGRAAVTGEDVTTYHDLAAVRVGLEELYHNSQEPGGTSANLNAPYPMSSELKHLANISTTSTSNLVLGMKFSFARVDVYASAAKSNFKLKGARLLNGQAAGTLFDFSEPAVTSTSILYAETPAVKADSVSPIYLFENHLEATEVLVRGDYTAPDGKVYGNGYYKIRIVYNQAGTDNFDILRNTQYAIQIKAINGPGYVSEQDAIDRQPHNIDYAITISDAVSQDLVIANGEYYLGVSNSEYILYADEASGVVALTLTHNAPATTHLPKISLQGSGFTFYANQGLLLNPAHTEATLPAGNGKEQSYAIRLNMSEACTEGLLSVRVGNLVKNVVLKKKPHINEDQTISLNADEFGGADFEWIKSESDRITVGPSNSLVVAPHLATQRSNRLISEVKAFDADQRGSVVIAIKRKANEVVYYEQYLDGTYGIFFEPTAIPDGDIVDTKEILEAGYGILKSDSKLTSMQVSFGDDTHVGITSRAVKAGFSDYAGTLYPVSQNAMKMQSAVDQALLVVADQESTGQYIHPNYAKGVYAVAAITNSETAPFVIRTPLQFKNINKISGPIAQAFIQETDLDFSKAALGGETFTSSIIGADFVGMYNGTNKAIRNVAITSSQSNLGVFGTLRDGAVIQNLKIDACTVTGSAYRTGLLVGAINVTSSNSRTILIDNIHLQNSSVYGVYYTGGIIGEVYGSMSSSGVVIQNSTTDDQCFVLGQGYYNEFGTGGIVGEVRFNTSVLNCVNRGRVSTRQLGLSGGICGNARAGSQAYSPLIVGCKNYGMIEGGQGETPGSVQQHASVGGILGHSWDGFTVVKNCDNYGPINAGVQTAGGIVGHMYFYATVDNCRNYGDFMAKDAGGINYLYQHCGGIVGWIEGGANTITGSINYGFIAGTSNVGGIVGHSGPATNTSITRCSNFGKVHSIGTGYNNYTAGGIVGQGVASLSECMVVGTGSGSTPFISGSGYVGGIAGYSTNSIEDACVIDTRTTPNTPLVVVEGSANGFAGGIVGYGVSIQRVFYAGIAPYTGGLLCPVSGNSVSVTSSFFLQGATFNAGAVRNGTGQNTTTFSAMSLVELGAKWERADGYPYPKLKEFPVPSVWPVVE